jgi:hypothetical protein
MDIPGKEALEIIAKKILALYVRLPENDKKEKNCFYLIAYSSNNVISTWIGPDNPIGRDVFTGQAIEKMIRLSKNSIKKGHVSSWESRYLPERKYGGAILAKKDCMISVAGLGQEGDEAVALAIALEISHMEKSDHNKMTKDEAERIAGISSNNLFPPLMKKLEFLWTKLDWDQ